MSTDLEADLRREFDSVGAPSGLTFSPESVLRQGNRTVRRHRLIAAGSAATAVGLMAVGANLIARPHDTALPPPANRTATTGIVKSEAVGDPSGTYDVEFNRDARVTPNVRYFFRPRDGQRQEIGTSSTGKPGQRPDPVWISGIVDGHPATMGLVPSTSANLAITFTGGVGATSGRMSGELEGTGYTWFAVSYIDGATRPSDIASIRWSGPTGIVDGIEGDHRLTGRILTLSNETSVEVALRPVDGGGLEVFGRTLFHIPAGSGSSTDLKVATIDPSGVAVLTGRDTWVGPDNLSQTFFHNDGPPIAAGILPAGATDIAVVLTTGNAANPIIVSDRMPDGSVIFAVKAEGAQPSSPSTDSIKAVTWTNADGSQGRMDVTQQPG